MKYEVKNNKIILNNNQEIDFKWPIDQVLDYQNIIVVSVEPEPGACENENVFAYQENGTLLWQIQEMGLVYDDSPYTNIARVDDDKVELGNWCGLELIVDILNGQIISKKWGR